MNNIFLTKFDTEKDEKLTIPKSGIVPIGVSEKLVRDEVKKFTENSEEIKKLKEQIDEKNAKEN
jgi:hypothetical protein